MNTDLMKSAVTWLSEASVAASLLALLVLVVQLAFGKRLSPAWRFMLWMPVVVRLLLPVLPEARFSLYNAVRWFEPSQPAPSFRVEILEIKPAPGLIRAEATESEISAPPPGATPLEKEGRPMNLAGIVAIVWVAGTGLFLLRLAAGFVWMRVRLRRDAQPAGAEIQNALRECAREVRVRIVPRVLETNVVSSPVLFGLLKPVLLLPPGLGAALSQSELRHVLMHELAHCKRGDVWLNWLMSFTQAVHWFNPVVWRVLRQMRLERELACDEIVLRSGPVTAAGEYGETILKLLVKFQRPAPLSAMVGILEDKREAQARMRSIARFGSGVKRIPILGGLLLCAIAVAGLTRAQSPKPAAVEPSARPVSAKQLPRSLEELMSATAAAEIEKIELEGLTVSEALGRIQDALPAGLKDLGFKWTDSGPVQALTGSQSAQTATSDTSRSTPKNLAGSKWTASAPIQSQAGVYAVNATGFITMPIEQAELPRTIRVAMRNIERNSPRDAGMDLSFRNEPLARVLHALAAAAERPLAWELTTNGINFFLRAADASGTNKKTELKTNLDVKSQNDYGEKDRPLYTRTYRLDPRLIVRELELFARAKGYAPEAQTPKADSPGPSSEIAKQIGSFLKEKAGVDFTNHEPVITPGQSQSSRAVFFNDRTGVLFARATLQELDKIETLLQRLNTPMIVIETRFFEINNEDLDLASFGKLAVAKGRTNTVKSEREFPTLKNPMTAEEVQALRAHAATLPPDPIMFESVFTITGLMEVEKVRPLIESIRRRRAVEQTTARLLTRKETRRLLAETEKAEGVDILSAPRVATVSHRAARVAIESDDKRETSVDTLVQWEQNGKALVTGVVGSVPLPEPQATATMGCRAVLYDGQSILLTGGIRSVLPGAERSGEKPATAASNRDIPAIGRLFRTGTPRKRSSELAILVTVSVVDGAGNRIFAEEEGLPFDPETIPPQE